MTVILAVIAIVVIMTVGIVCEIRAARDRRRRNELLSEALAAIILTREYVGNDYLPCNDGWCWWDAVRNIADEIPDDDWSYQLRLRTGYRPGDQ